MLITKIEVQKKNKERYNIYMDKKDGNGEQYAFSVDQDTLIRYELKKGKELDDLSLTEVLFSEDIRKAMNMALNYLSYQMRTTKEVYIFLEEKEVSIPIIQEVLTSLKQQSYLDDKEYAYAYVRTHSAVSGKGPSLIREDLKEKGVLTQNVEEALEECYSFEKQIENAQKWMKKKQKSAGKYSSRELEAKIKQYLLVKGFSWNVIHEVMEQIEENEELQLDALRLQFQKYDRKYKKFEGWEYEQKIKAALYRKGFQIEQIERILDEMKEA